MFSDMKAQKSQGHFVRHFVFISSDQVWKCRYSQESTIWSTKQWPGGGLSVKKMYSKKLADNKTRYIFAFHGLWLFKIDFLCTSKFLDYLGKYFMLIQELHSANDFKLLKSMTPPSTSFNRKISWKYTV
jgi:hypothetical protein